MNRRLGILALALVACGDSAAPRDGGGPDTGPPDAAIGPNTCEEGCNDFVACTIDSCIGSRCVHAPDHAACDDGDWCNGAERCDGSTGCAFAGTGPCNDGDVCTTDRCDAEAMTCSHEPRDADGDGAVDVRCGGADCDDGDPRLDGVDEICGDSLDNDCDGLLDEIGCVVAPYDACDDPLDVSAGGSFLLRGPFRDEYTLSCGGARAPDAVAQLTLAAARSVTVTGTVDFGSVALELRQACEDAGSALTCRAGSTIGLGRRRLEAGTYYVVASSDRRPLSLDVEIEPPLPPVPNESCATPTDVGAGGTFTESTIELTDDHTTRCGSLGYPDLVYRLVLTEPRDVAITARSNGGTATVAYEVRSACADPSSDLRCARSSSGLGATASGSLHELSAGTYDIIVEVGAARPVDLALDVALTAPTPAPSGDLCNDPLPLIEGDNAGTFAGFADDYGIGCSLSGRDVIHSFSLPSASDIDLRLDTDTVGALSLRSACDTGASELACTLDRTAAMVQRGLPAGIYYVIASSIGSGAYSLDFDRRAPRSPVVVAGNEDCDSAQFVDPVTGGVFRGDTSTMTNDLSTSSCSSATNSPDAVFSLELSETRHVRIDTTGSSYDTVVHLHQNSCADDGDEHCSDDGGVGAASRLDLNLPAGTWFIVIDGRGTATDGSYVLDVLVSDP